MRTNRPAAHSAIEPPYDVIPEELRARNQWVVWWSVVGEGRTVQLPNGGFTEPLKRQKKSHKLPINPHSGGLASSTKPQRVYNLIREGIFPAGVMVRLGRRIRVNPEKLEEFIASGRHALPGGWRRVNPGGAAT